MHQEAKTLSRSYHQLMGFRAQGSGIPAFMRPELAFMVPLPTIIELRQELADVWLKAGAVGAAMEEFEAIQAWEPLITCYLMAGMCHCSCSFAGC